MPRYLIERRFVDGLRLPTDDSGVQFCHVIVENNVPDGVTWLTSYVSADRKRVFCVYEAPTPEAIRRVASRNRLPVHEITEVRVLDPYFYR